MSEADELAPDQMAMPRDEPDDRWAGMPLSEWLGHVPEEAVLVALKAAADAEGVDCVARSTPLPLQPYKKWWDNQRKVLKAHVASHRPDLQGRVKLMTRTLPWRGIGPDCTVGFVRVEPSKVKGKKS